MEPFDAVFLSFVGTEGIFVWLGGDPVASLIPACLAATWACSVACKHKRKLQDETDNPPVRTYDLPAPQAFSVVKKILQTFRYEQRRWNLPYVDRSTYSLIAISEWRDRTESDPDSDRAGLKQITLQLDIRRDQPTSRTQVQLRWSIVSYGDRTECEALQSLTSFSLMIALREAEAKHIAVSAMYEDETDDSKNATKQ